MFGYDSGGGSILRATNKMSSGDLANVEITRFFDVCMCVVSIVYNADLLDGSFMMRVSLL